MAAHSEAVQSVGEMVMACMDAIAAQFKAPVRITVVVRAPDWPDGSRDMIVTADNLVEVIGAIQTQMATEEAARQENARQRISEAMAGRGQ